MLQVEILLCQISFYSLLSGRNHTISVFIKFGRYLENKLENSFIIFHRFLSALFFGNSNKPAIQIGKSELYVIFSPVVKGAANRAKTSAKSPDSL